MAEAISIGTIQEFMNALSQYTLSVYSNFVINNDSRVISSPSTFKAAFVSGIYRYMYESSQYLATDFHDIPMLPGSTIYFIDTSLAHGGSKFTLTGVLYTSISVTIAVFS